MNDKRQRRTIWILSILVLLSLAFVGWTGYRIFTQAPGQETITSGGITVEKPTNSVVDATITDDGYLLIKYANGTERRVGTIAGSQGAVGASGSNATPPSQTEIALAIMNYCSDGRCDAKNPSTEQVASAVFSYCSTGICKGDAGASTTTDQVMAAVTQYCSDGRCAGPQGAAGSSGINGRTTVMACVQRTVTAVDTQFVAWKYSDELDTAYRDLYKLPIWAQGSSCIDLRGV